MATLPPDPPLSGAPAPSVGTSMPEGAGGSRGLLVGYGSIGRRHLSNLHDLGVTDWAVVRTGSGTIPFEPPCPARTYPDLATALAAERPAFAVVANPTALHAETALACVMAGCDVLIEKPVSHAPDGLADLERVAAAHEAAVVVGFQFRFDPGLRRVAQLLESRAAGDPVHVRSTWGEYLPDWHPWEDWRVGYAARPDLGGGVHHTLCHPLDYLSMLFGRPTLVGAFLRDHGPLGLEVAEAADIRLCFAGGVSAQVHLDYWSRPARHDLEIVCTAGSIRWDHIAGEVRVWRTESPGWQVERVPGVEARDALFVAEARHFLDVMARRTPPACTLAEGIQAVRLCAAIDESSAQTRRNTREAP